MDSSMDSNMDSNMRLRHGTQTWDSDMGLKLNGTQAKRDSNGSSMD